MRYRHLAFGAALALVAAGSSPALANTASGPSTLVIGVDHVDGANQRPDLNRVFEYTDFFSRDVNVHRGEVVDFRTAPGGFHAVGLADSETTARHVYPIVAIDSDDSVNATGSGLPKIELGPSNFPITGGSTSGGGVDVGASAPPCGLAGEAVCTFKGANDIESAGPLGGFDSTGNPAPVDWKIEIDAAPGKYDFLCFLHPGMQGTLTVVPDSDAATTQLENNQRAQQQFHDDRANGLEAEQEANVVHFTGGVPGTRTYRVDVSTVAPDLHTTILEMLPRSLDVKVGDQVEYHWRSPNEVHTVAFPTDSPNLPEAFVFDCGTSVAPTSGPPCFEPGKSTPEVIGDPGLTPSGSALRNPSTLVDAGLLAGTGYQLNPSRQTWEIKTNASTAAGTYQYQCTVHDFMHGELVVSK